ncbi:MAG: T9SS type A sorting domain-containing protein [Candidatus Cloacimonetes bacterium]|nr:T9SS type A sorting domain-containing protein [Candidatus Cloacimonadota bacterium]
MKKRIICLVCIFSFLMSLYALIDNIDNIRFDSILSDFGSYNYAINKYNDKLFVDNLYRIGEYHINEDGSLELNHVHETVLAFEPSSFIHNHKLYYNELKSDSDLYTYRYLSVADITQSPMQHLQTVNTEIDRWYGCSRGIYNEKILLGDSANSIGRLFNIDSLEYEAYINDADGVFAVTDSVFIQAGWITVGGNNITSLRFFNLNEVENNELPDFFNEVVLSEEEYVDVVYLKCEDGLLYVMGFHYLEIFDIDDINNPVSIFHRDITGEFDFWYYVDAVLSGDIVFAITIWADVMAFDINTSDIIYEEAAVRYGASQFGSLCLDYPIIYCNRSEYLTQYELEPDVNKIKDYGVFQGVCRHNIDYVVTNDISNQTLSLFSTMFDNIYTTTRGDIYDFGSFDVNDNKLFLRYTKYSYEQGPIFKYWFDIYELSGNELLLLNSIELGFVPIQTRVIGNFLYFGKTLDGLDLTEVYRINEGELEFYTVLNGYMQGLGSHVHSDFICICYNGVFEFRDKASPEDILFYYSFDFINGDDMPSFIFVNEDTFMAYGSSNSASVYRVNDNSIEYMYSHNYATNNTVLIPFGELMVSYESYSRIKNIESIGNYGFSEVGSFNALYNSKEFFFPEHNKMLSYTQEGAFLYSFDYTVANADYTVEKPKTISVYPNPCISGNVNFKGEQTKKISIYNIKGQLVKRLENSNVHDSSFIWDKKDQNNHKVASGIYFYKAETAKGMQTGKLMILK